MADSGPGRLFIAGSGHVFPHDVVHVILIEFGRVTRPRSRVTRPSPVGHRAGSRRATVGGGGRGRRRRCGVAASVYVAILQYDASVLDEHVTHRRRGSRISRDVSATSRSSRSSSLRLGARPPSLRTHTHYV